MKPVYSDGIEEDKSLLNLAAAYVKQSPKHIADAESKANKEAKREAKLKQLEAIAEKSAQKDVEDDEKEKDEPLVKKDDINPRSNMLFA